jgi:hypothetical protein
MSAPSPYTNKEEMKKIEGSKYKMKYVLLITYKGPTLTGKTCRLSFSLRLIV